MSHVYPSYYSFELETLANDNVHPSYELEKKWGAHLVMAYATRRECRIDNKKWMKMWLRIEMMIKNLVCTAFYFDEYTFMYEGKEDACFLSIRSEYEYNNHSSSSLSSSSFHPFQNQAYNDADRGPLFYLSFSSNNNNKRQ
ncbi:hypothetical protein BDB01DRAFT_831557 [Pilobolus umbonatus]|nr:hypothetical protein BDB01DRAFT_831557 [Pilobolus umbonatus]